MKGGAIRGCRYFCKRSLFHTFMRSSLRSCTLKNNLLLYKSGLHECSSACYWTSEGETEGLFKRCRLLKIIYHLETDGSIESVWVWLPYCSTAKILVFLKEGLAVCVRPLDQACTLWKIVWQHAQWARNRHVNQWNILAFAVFESTHRLMLDHEGQHI